MGTICETVENNYIRYMDTQDIAKFCLRSLQLPETRNKTIFLNGPKEWVSSEILALCKKLAGQSTKIESIPLVFLKLGSDFFGFFEWGENISNRLAFVEILTIIRPLFNIYLRLFVTEYYP